MTQAAKLKSLAHYGFGISVMRRTRLCLSCGTLVTDGSEVCSNCGKRLPEPTLFTWYAQRHMVCVRCGTVLRGDTIYCPCCGKRVRRQISDGMLSQTGRGRNVCK